jgi:hypothetical protein
MINSHTHSQTKTWKQGRSPVGRVVLIPTSAYVTNNPYRSIETLYANVSYLYGLLIYANYCRDEGNPTYRFLRMKNELPN